MFSPPQVNSDLLKQTNLTHEKSRFTRFHRERHVPPLVQRLSSATFFALLFLIQFVFHFNAVAQSDGIPRGAQLPYTRYESEDGSRGGGASLQAAPTYDYNLIASEASNQKYVSLPSNGSYVEWTAATSFQGVNLRFTLPDNASGIW